MATGARDEFCVIALVGLPGSGKTSAGKILAESRGFYFADTDEWIETAQRRSISSIFSSQGEAFFRKLEKDALRFLRLWLRRSGFPKTRRQNGSSERDDISSVFGAHHPASVLSLEERIDRIPPGSAVADLLRVVLHDLRQAEGCKGLIIAGGGGLFVPADNRELLKSIATTIYLQCQTSILSHRLAQDSTRPLLVAGRTESEAPEKAILKRLDVLLAERQQAYQTAHLTIDTSHLTTTETANSIEQAVITFNQL